MEPTWTAERIERLIELWEEGVTTAEIGRRIGVTKNAVIGKVHRLGLVPRVVTEKPAPRRNVFEFNGPVCMWPIGHPGEEDFHFCGGRPVARQALLRRPCRGRLYAAEGAEGRGGVVT